MDVCPKTPEPPMPASKNNENKYILDSVSKNIMYLRTEEHKRYENLKKMFGFVVGMNLVMFFLVALWFSNQVWK